MSGSHAFNNCNIEQVCLGNLFSTVVGKRVFVVIQFDAFVVL